MAAASLETELLRRHFDDGLLDLFAGLTIAGMGLSWVFGAFIYAAVAPALMIPLYMGARRRWIAPRTGAVDFTAGQKARGRSSLNRLTIVFSISAGLGLVAFYLVDSGAMQRLEISANAILAVPGLVFAAAALVVAFALSLVRFAAYALVFALAAVLLHLPVEGAPGVDFALAALAPVIGGAVLLNRFLRAPRGDAD